MDSPSRRYEHRHGILAKAEMRSETRLKTALVASLDPLPFKTL